MWYLVCHAVAFLLNTKMSVGTCDALNTGGKESSKTLELEALALELELQMTEL